MSQFTTHILASRLADPLIQMRQKHHQCCVFWWCAPRWPFTQQQI